MFSSTADYIQSNSDTSSYLVNGRPQPSIGSQEWEDRMQCCEAETETERGWEECARAVVRCGGEGLRRDGRAVEPRALRGCRRQLWEVLQRVGAVRTRVCWVVVHHCDAVGEGISAPSRAHRCKFVRNLRVGGD